MTQIHWLKPVSADFSTAADWSTGAVPGAADAAILDAPGANFTVTQLITTTVASIQTAANATLIIGGTFTATRGTGTGVNAGQINVFGNFLVGGAFMNTGAISVVGQGIPKVTLTIRTSLTLEGGGTLSLVKTRNYGGYIIGVGTQAVLTNVDNTISGVGFFGDRSHPIKVINEAGGVIDANGNGRLALGSSRPWTNAGLIEATGPGILNMGGPLDNTGGTIAATGSGYVTFFGGSIVNGSVMAGTDSYLRIGLTSMTNAALSTAAGGQITLLGSTVTTCGVIANAGTIQLAAEAGFAGSLVLNNASTLTGGGSVGVNPESTIQGINGAVVLTNVDNTIYGVGGLGNGNLTLINEAAGVIDGSRLNIDTGANTVVNAGLIELTNAYGVMTIASPISNTGTLEVNGGTFTVEKDVTNAHGMVVVNSGTITFQGGLNERVNFVGGAGVLRLAKSAVFHQAITGFSASGGTALDLGDIGFVSSGQASFSGTAAQGVLTVSDGTHTDRITLKGNYLSAVFTASSDGAGGTIIVATTPAPALPPAHPLIAAMASLSGPPAASVAAFDHIRPHALILARPGAAVA